MQYTIEQLRNEGNLIDTVQEGTVSLYEIKGEEYLILQDNTIISRQEDNAAPEGSYWPIH